MPLNYNEEDGTVVIEMGDDDGNTFEIVLKPPKNGRLELSVNNDGTIDMATEKSDGKRKSGTIDPGGGSKSLGV